MLCAFSLAAACGGGRSGSRAPTPNPTAPSMIAGSTSTPSSPRPPSWAGAWAAPPSDAGGSFVDQTLRLHLTPHRDGTDARVRLSNRFGTVPLRLGRVTLARQGSGAEVVAGSTRPVEFSGRPDVVIAVGDDVVSDAVTFDVRADEPLALSVWVRGDSGAATRHAQAKQRSFASPRGSGDLTAEESGAAFTSVITEEVLGSVSRPFVTELEVVAPPDAPTVVALGDSLTDGDLRLDGMGEIDVDVDARYPDVLARRLRALDPRWSVVNAGIGGNRLLGPSTLAIGGPSVLSRLAADVERRDDLSDVIVLVGINDLGGRPDLPAAELVDGLQELVARLHRPRERCPDGVHVVVGTLPPTGGAQLSDYAKVAGRREAVNDAIRAGGIGDAVVDFDAALRDPDRPGFLDERYDSGDGLHPSSVGYARMADVVDLDRLSGTRCGALVG